MADEKDASPVFTESFFQLIFCIYIQVIGGLIQEKDIGVTVYQLAEAYLRLLTTTSDTHLTLDMLGRQATFCQCGTYLILGK